MEFAVPADHILKIKKKRKKDKYLELAERRSGDLRKSAIIQIPVKDYQQMLV